MASMLNDTLKIAKNVIEAATEGTERTVSTTRSALTVGAKMVAGMIGTLRRLDRDDALAWAGLERRASPLRSLVIFAAGAVAGAAASMLLTPMSGARARGAIRERFTQLGKEAQATAAQLGTTMKQAEHKVETQVGAAVEAVKEGVTQKTDAVAGAVKNAYEDATGAARHEQGTPRSQAAGSNHRPS